MLQAAEIRGPYLSPFYSVPVLDAGEYSVSIWMHINTAWQCGVNVVDDGDGGCRR